MILKIALCNCVILSHIFKTFGYRMGRIIFGLVEEKNQIITNFVFNMVVGL